MKKRGQIETVALIIGGILLVSSILASGVYSEKIISTFRYVGDSNSSIVYDSAKCDLSNLKFEDKISFDTKEEAISKGFREADCNFK